MVITERCIHCYWLDFNLSTPHVDRMVGKGVLEEMLGAAVDGRSKLKGLTLALQKLTVKRIKCKGL